MFWEITSKYDTIFRCGEITFTKGGMSHSLDVSENEYLYDLDAATLRTYRNYIAPIMRARKVMGTRIKRDKANRRTWVKANAKNSFASRELPSRKLS